MFPNSYPGWNSKHYYQSLNQIRLKSLVSDVLLEFKASFLDFYSNLNSKFHFQLTIQIQIKDSFFESLFEFEISFRNSYLNLNLRLRFVILIRIRIKGFDFEFEDFFPNSYSNSNSKRGSACLIKWEFKFKSFILFKARFLNFNSNLNLNSRLSFQIILPIRSFISGFLLR